MSERGRITRREVLRGRFLGTLLETIVDRVTPLVEPAIDPAPQMIMRYPKTDRDVDAVTSPNGEGSTVAARIRGSIPVLRPPGAVDEATFLSECTRCDECVTACPHDAIVHAPARFREAAGTPMIDADRQPCMMCEDFPCIAACEPDVLSNLVPKMMGTARITEQTCLAHHGTTCTVCSEHCPVEDAIAVVAGRPRIVEERCTGCGVCRHVCPSPENAVLLMPTFVRPPRPA